MKRGLASLLALLQVAWSAGPGAAGAAAQTVSVQVQAPAGAPGVASVGAAVAAPVGGVALPAPALTPAGGLQALQTFSPAIQPGASLQAGAAPAAAELRLPAGLASPAGEVSAAALEAAGRSAPGAVETRALPSAPAHAAALAAPARAAGPAALAVLGRARDAAAGRSLRSELEGLRARSSDAPGESARGAADASFNALYRESLIRGSGEAAGPAVSAGRLGALIPGQDRLTAASELPKAVRSEPAAPQAAPRPSRTPAYLKAAAAVAAALAVAAAAPLLAGHAALVAAIGSVALSVIGLPQIVKNFRGGRESVKDLVIAGPLIWFAAATMLSVASIGRGSSAAWNAVNLAGVLESAIVVGQIAAYKRDKADLKAAALTAAAVLAPLGLVALEVLMPLKAWADLAFTAAMGLLWVLNWPQIRKNYQLYQAEGRPPRGIAPLSPALVTGGSLLHLFAALVGGDLRWALNAVVAIATAGAVLAQLYFPRAANAVVGPLARLQDRLAAVAARDPAAPVRAALAGADLSRFASADGEAKLAEAVARAKALPGRSVIFLEAPTAAGKSTLAKSLEAALGKRIRPLEVDRYFKPARDVPRDEKGQPDFDRPDAMYLDRVAADLRALLAGGRVELPLHDMAAETTRFDSGEFMELGEDEVLVVDSIFASHPLLRAAARGQPSLNLYLDAPAVVRLARRLARDKVSRGKPVLENLKGWSRILDDERANILPMRAQADLVLKLVKAEELGGLAAAYARLVAEEDPALRRETAALLAAMIRASLAADGT